VDEEHVRLIVRATARMSALVFLAALGLFAAGHRAGPRRVVSAIRVFVLFVVAHTIHFGAVVWLAVATAGENIRERDGWPVVVVVAAAFYLSVFGILRLWTRLSSRQAVSHRERRGAQVGVLFIAAIFVNSYLARVKTMPVYWLWTAGMVLVVTAYLLHTRRVQDDLELPGTQPH
jgi:hypothetical protein